MATATQQCPQCGGEMWDETQSKYYKPSKPIAKCKDKACGGVVWPPREHGARPQGGNGRPAAPAPAPRQHAAGDLPGDPASNYQNGGNGTAAPAPTRPTLAELAGRYDRCLGYAKKIAAKHEGEIQWTADALTSVAATLYIEANRRGVDQ